MKFQTNPSLGGYINHWGCHIISILQKVEKLSGGKIKLSNSDVCAIYLKAKSDGAVQAEISDCKGNPLDGCDVYHGDHLFNIAVEMFNFPIRCIEYRKESALYIPSRGEEEILELKRDGYKGSHFVAGNGKPSNPWQKEIEFDPIEGGSKCASLGWIASKRIMTVRRI